MRLEDVVLSAGNVTRRENPHNNSGHLGTTSIHWDNFVANKKVHAKRGNGRAFNVGTRQTLRTRSKPSDERDVLFNCTAAPTHSRPL